MTTSAAGLVEDEEEDGPTRRVMFGVKLWPTTIALVDAVAARRYPTMNPARRKSQAARDLISLGLAAEAAGYQPGDPIPRKRPGR